MTDWTTGYTRSELDAAQERFSLRFPPDLVELFLDRRPIKGWDWRTDNVGIRGVLERPLEGILFDVEHNDLWWPKWGGKPAAPDEQAEVVRAVVKVAPALIPLIAHRYIPEEPHESGNPIFSVMQSDVIYYGANLTEYFANEFGGTNRIGAVRRIPFWSEMVDRNY